MSFDVLIVQHAEKEQVPGDPGLTPLGHQQARTIGAHLHATGPVDLLRTWFGDEHLRELATGAIEHGIAPCAVTRIALEGNRRTLPGVGEHAEALG